MFGYDLRMDMPSPLEHTTRSGRPRLEPRAFEVAARLRSRRKQLGLTIAYLADKVGVPNPRYRSWEKQLGPATESQYLDALARILQVELEWLSHGTGASPISADQLELPANTDGHIRLTQNEQNLLATRARDRREALLLDRQEVAERIGISTLLLKSWERMLPQKRKRDFEIRWEAVLGVPEGWLRLPEMETPPPTREVVKQTVSIEASTVSGEIRKVGAWLSRANFAKRTTEYGQLTMSERRKAEMFALRYGVGGEASSTLQNIGDRLGLTRERVRQIVSTMLERADRMQLKTPMIDRLEEMLKPHLPATVESLDATFRYLLGESLSIESVGRFSCEILGRNVVTMTDRPADMAHNWSPTVIDPDNHDAERIRSIRDAAMRMIRTCGAAQVLFVAGAAGESLGRGVLPGDVVHDCRMVPGFEWLIEKDGWFWYGESKENRLIAVATKILTAAGQRVDAEEILGGLVRSRRGNYEPDRQRSFLIEPPLQLVIEVLRRATGFKNIQHDDFFLESSDPVEAVLSDAEVAVYRLMSANGNLASRYTLNSQLVDGGQVKHMALQVSLDNSPIYRQLDRGVFALRGAPLSATFLQLALDSVGGDVVAVALPSERDQEGFYHFSSELTENMAQHRYWSLPTRYARLLDEGEYVLEGFDEPVIFARQYGYNRVKRFLSKIISLGLSVGDVFELAINPETRRMRVTMSIKRPDFVHEPSPSSL